MPYLKHINRQQSHIFHLKELDVAFQVQCKTQKYFAQINKALHAARIPLKPFNKECILLPLSIRLPLPGGVGEAAIPSKPIEKEKTSDRHTNDTESKK